MIAIIASIALFILSLFLQLKSIPLPTNKIIIPSLKNSWDKKKAPETGAYKSVSRSLFYFCCLLGYILKDEFCSFRIVIDSARIDLERIGQQ